MLRALFDFGFLIKHMLPSFRIKFHQLQLAFVFRSGSFFVFGGGIKVASASTGYQFDFVSHRWI